MTQTRHHVQEALSKQEAEVSVDHSSGNASLQKAQSLAKNILNLSQSDMDDIMSCNGEPTQQVFSFLGHMSQRPPRGLLRGIHMSVLRPVDGPLVII